MYIDKKTSQKILTLGVSKSTYGGMTAVLVSYEKCFEAMRFIPTWRLGNKGVKAWYAFQAMVRCFFLLLFDKRITILHIHGAANASFYRKAVFINMGKYFYKKIIFHQHAADFKDFFEQSKDKQNIVDIINCCDTLIVLSQSWKLYFTSIGIIENKIYVLNNIVFPPKEKPVRIAHEKLHLLFLGEIGNRKGIYDLLNVLNKGKKYFKNKITLRIGGNVADGDVNAFITEHDISSFVTYEGWVSGVKKTTCLEWADVYILPSYNEGLPIAILEAMSYSHPIISTNVGGIPEVVQSHKNGILIEAGNLEEIKNALMFFIENPKKIAEYGENAYETVQAYFPQSVFSELIHIYMHMLKT